MELSLQAYANYIERRKKDLEVLTKAYESNDPEPFKRIGHQLKGNASSFGFDELGVIGARMETITSTDGLSLHGSKVLADFESWINRISEKQSFP